MMLYEILPKNPAVSFDRLLNQLLTKREITQVVDEVYRHCGQKETVVFADHLMALGFSYAAKAGISFGKDDMVVPEAKSRLVHETRELVKQYEQQYADGLITKGEKYNKVVDAWAQCTDRVAEEMMAQIRASAKIRNPETGRVNQPNSIYMMADSAPAARRRRSSSWRACAASWPSRPARSSRRRSSPTSRRGCRCSSTSTRRTAPARSGRHRAQDRQLGYLTRRLVDVAQDCIIVEDDCGTDRHITLPR